jgi:sterol desaturase/sphingolipid hydroxylase (fatty acid hydroxylase superfamily)
LSIALIVLCAGAGMMLIEYLAPGRSLPEVNRWWTRAIALNAVQAGTVFLAGVSWDILFSGHAVIRIETVLGPLGGAIAGYFIITFIYYWWHRMRHKIPFLWRIFHQLHHSPQRIEIITSFYKNPVEIVGNSILSSAILYVLCGLTPQSATLAILLTGLAELFYHWNVRTPYWVGFIFQRPESHCIHHRRDWHTQNYADLPLWDMLFGTFNNPRSLDVQCGFRPKDEARVGDMLRWVDLSAQRGTKQ